jgi:hypothetical protein
LPNRRSFSYGKITNGFAGSDGWPLIINWEMPKTDNGGVRPRRSVPFSLPKPQTITEFTWIGNQQLLDSHQGEA